MHARVAAGRPRLRGSSALHHFRLRGRARRRSAPGGAVGSVGERIKNSPRRRAPRVILWARFDFERGTCLYIVLRTRSSLHVDQDSPQWGGARRHQIEFWKTTRTLATSLDHPKGWRGHAYNTQPQRAAIRFTQVCISTNTATPPKRSVPHYNILSRSQTDRTTTRSREYERVRTPSQT